MTGMKDRVLLMVMVLGTMGALVPARAAPDVCTWGGTPAAPTGRFTFEPGLHFQPSSGPLKFKAWGPATGARCARTVVFEGVALPGATCADIFFDGRVKGVSGVERFNGGGASTDAIEPLYDRNGAAVGTDTPNADDPWLIGVVGGDAIKGEFTCNSPEGLTSGSFSSVITLFGR
jgi:hypothetical protein